MCTVYIYVCGFTSQCVCVCVFEHCLVGNLKLRRENKVNKKQAHLSSVGSGQGHHSSSTARGWKLHPHRSGQELKLPPAVQQNIYSSYLFFPFNAGCVNVCRV